MQTQESLARDILRLIIWYPFRWLIKFLTPSKGLFCIAALGDIHYLLSRKKRALLQENLLRLFPHMPTSQIRSECRRYMQTHYLNQLIIFIFPSLTPAHLEKMLAWRGMEHLHHALSSGNGVVLAHPHFGPVHLPLFALGRMGYRVKQIGNPSDAGLSWIGRHVSFRLRVQYEKRIPAEIVPVGSDYRKIFRHLKEGNPVMITADGSGTQEQYGKHIALAFHNQIVEFPLGASSLSLRTGATLLPMFLEPVSSTQWRCTIEPPIQMPHTMPRKEAIEKATAEFAVRYAQYTEKWPGCMHFLDRLSPGHLIKKT